ncbi:MAG: CorA family divalent cation transporter [Bacteroidales bacterium]|jgi:magnesium transporter
MENIKETKYEHFKWIDIVKPQKDQLEKVATEYKLDYFQILDSMEHGHLPKFEKLPEYDFAILRAYVGGNNNKHSTVKELTNKIAFFYNDTKIITIHRENFDFLENIDQKFNNTYQLLIFIISQMLETYIQPSIWHSNKIDDVEKVIFLKDYTKISLEDLYFQKSQTRISKKLLMITQDVVNKIVVDDNSKTALQDVKDKILSLILIYDEVAEDANNLMHTYLSVTAKKSNDVMKLLTIFSVFFLPLTFIVGVYGMNFDFMPEIRWKYGYLFVWIMMMIISLIIYIWFKNRKIF